MTTLRELCNIPPNKILLMEIFKKGAQVAEQDISDMTPRKLQQAIEEQEMQGRTWTYRTINLNDGR